MSVGAVREGAAPDFVLAGVGRGTAADALGPWAAAPAAAGAAAFGAGSFSGAAAEREAGATRWLADLPADRRLAAAHLAAAEAGQSAVAEGLGAASLRLDRLVAARGVEAFTVDVGPAPAAPEAALLRALDDLRAGGAVAYGVGDDLAGAWARATEAFQVGAARLDRVVGHQAWVETRVEGRLLGRTIVGWGGAAGTAWAAPLDPATAAPHRRTLALALAARATLLRRLALAARGAVTLGALLAPGGALLALPAAWRFIGEVVDEVAAARGGVGDGRTEEARGG